MDFAYSEEQQQARDNVIRFARGELNRNFNDADGDAFPDAQWSMAADLGLLGLTVSEEHGGGGLDCVSAAAIFDALGYACLDHGFAHAICTQNLCAIHIDEYGSDEQKSRILASAFDGTRILAQAITEPSAGSDTSDIKATAIKNDDSYIINGSKTFTTNGPIAEDGGFANVVEAGGKHDASE